MTAALALFKAPEVVQKQVDETRLDKRVQKVVPRRTVDYLGPYVKFFQSRITSASALDRVGNLIPRFIDSIDVLPPIAYVNAPASNLPSKLVHATLSRARSAVNAVAWTPDGRRCIIGAGNGEISRWDAATFAFESAMQAHEAAVRCCLYTHSKQFFASCDDSGKVKFFLPNFELLTVVQAHREACRCVTFAPTDLKFATSSDDALVKVHDFVTGQTEASMPGHGGDVRWVDWHPCKGVIASASKDHLVKIWDPRSSTCVSTLHGHKNGVMQVRWNRNGNWLLTCSRDNLLKIFDVRSQKCLMTYKGHTRDVTSCTWHPLHEELFSSGSQDGALFHWLVSRPEPQLQLLGAHDREVWALQWHPVGHMLISGSQDHGVKVWVRARPGDIFQAGVLEGGLTDDPPPSALQAMRYPAAASGIMSSVVPSSAAAGIIMGKGVIPGIGVVAQSRTIIPGIGGAATSTAAGVPGLLMNSANKKEGQEIRNEGPEGLATHAVLGSSEQKRGTGIEDEDSKLPSSKMETSGEDIQGRGVLDAAGPHNVVASSSSTSAARSVQAVSTDSTKVDNLPPLSSSSTMKGDLQDALEVEAWDYPESKRRRLMLQHPNAIMTAGREGGRGRGRGSYWSGGRDSYQPAKYPSPALSHYQRYQGGRPHHPYAGRGHAPAAAPNANQQEYLYPGAGPALERDIPHGAHYGDARGSSSRQTSFCTRGQS
ncbi:hypothetical protein CEUSTIGMA_g4522.t1 [Chlamydomonas eustigma]|uniref:Uncharacterized protein n=1 Tax=Chlamydomonas eustigma TaxID=1157962 RepID=A0A250X201_9CHLO|nr:hypothetical protein CEUSTIGMA_g4522.t1 [Chlamydomonas eustigma]|eukprot:GAX77076.1 hypothetical protein CEUSTIGMA_g4522.t1 [Chlamydomonas eustigma]